MVFITMNFLIHIPILENNPNTLRNNKWNQFLILYSILVFQTWPKKRAMNSKSLTAKHVWSGEISSATFNPALLIALVVIQGTRNAVHSRNIIPKNKQVQRVCDASCAKKEIIKNGWFQWVKTTDHGREVLKWKSNMRIFSFFLGPHMNHTQG